MTKKQPTKPRAYRHDAAKRKNNPTVEDQVFLPDDERQPVKYSPSPAGTSGPVLSWRRGRDLGKIKTDALPLYTHEKVSPSAFVEQLTQGADADDTRGLFSEFNGLPADAKYDWYKYPANWSNRIIRGNSVDVMASLLVKEGMAGTVQMVYFDPPYGINFASNFQASTRRRNAPPPPPLENQRRGGRFATNMSTGCIPT